MPNDSDQDKKDLTGLFPLTGESAPSDPNTVASPLDTPTTIEQVTEFESIDQIGMVDHALETTQFKSTEPENSPAPPLSTDLFPVLEETPATDFSLETSSPTNLISDSPMPHPALDEIQAYAEQAQLSTPTTQIFYPFHLYINANPRGKFGPFERDKLLRFITENQIGISSSDLDLQLKSGKVFFPRISEFAGVKIIQDLRDSGLDFSLRPSDQSEGADEFKNHTPGLSYHYDTTPRPQTQALSAIIVLNAKSPTLAQYKEIDTLQANQFLKAEMIEVEDSDLFQEVLERMIESLKHKARAKGGDAIMITEQKISPLRLPSQYQVSLRVAVLKHLL